MVYRHDQLRALSTYPTSKPQSYLTYIFNLQFQLPTTITLLNSFFYLYLFLAVFEACCNVLERNLKPLGEEENNSEYLIGKEEVKDKDKDFSNFSSSKNRSNSDPGTHFLLY